jgi:hypothetical protein
MAPLSNLFALVVVAVAVIALLRQVTAVAVAVSLSDRTHSLLVLHTQFKSA